MTRRTFFKILACVPAFGAAIKAFAGKPKPSPWYSENGEYEGPMEIARELDIDYGPPESVVEIVKRRKEEIRRAMNERYPLFDG